jgi:hypothetical protein
LGQEGVYADLVAAGEIGSAVHVEDVDTIKYTN